MKKIIIMLMAISMLLVSCSTPNTPSYDDVIPTSTDSSSDNGNNAGNGSTPSNPTNPITQYTVTFNSNGGSSVNPQTVTPNGHATKPKPNPTKEGYIFDDWYENLNSPNKFNFDNTINRNIELKAKWLTLKDFTYRINHNSISCNSYFRDTCLEVEIPSYGTIFLDIILNGNEIKFTSRTNYIKVYNVTMDMTATPKPTVTIELANNN